MPPALEFIKPDWLVPDHIEALCTTRVGGVSLGEFASFNLATHVHDDPDHVRQNRDRLRKTLDLKSEPQWLNQTHSIRAIDLDAETNREGDAAFTRKPGQVAVVMTADCLPVLFCNQVGTEVGAAHAGWRGLVNGVLEQTIQAMRSPAHELLAWMGPAIGPDQFEVGAEVRSEFLQHDVEADACFLETRPGHYRADLYALARLRLKKAGIQHISGGGFCTFSEKDRFFSYRREKNTGRQASLIYIKT